MKYTPSIDGIDRTSFVLHMRLSEKEVEYIRNYLKDFNKSFTDSAIRKFIEDCFDEHSQIEYTLSIASRERFV